jgi:hypothetical protein
MDLQRLRIGYAPYGRQLTQPGDRRRFVNYARRRGLQFEIARPEECYDVVVVSLRGDLSVWGNYPRGKTKIVLDMVDSYLSVPKWDIKAILRGTAKFVVRETRHLQLSYRKAIQTMCRRADAVICTAENQKQAILPYCPNVHIILDFQDFLIGSTKENYSSGPTFNFVWEGLSDNLRTFSVIQDVLRELAATRKIALHVLTQLESPLFMGKYWKRQSSQVARKFFDGIFLYQWNEQLFSRIVTACDLALIPIPLDIPLYAGKSANKLILFWRFGVPAVVSATPAYESVLQQCGLPMACRTPEEWSATLRRYMDDENARRDAAERGKAYAEKYHSDEAITEQWDGLFASLLESATPPLA